MHLSMFLGHVLSAAFFSATAMAQVDITQFISQIPVCTEICVLAEISAAGCQLTNLTECMCTNTTVQKQLATCVLSSCNLTEQTVSSNILQEDVCKGVPQPSRSEEMIRIAITLAVITFTTVALRVASRFIGVQKFWWDDWAILAAAAFMVPLTAFAIIYPHHGVGKHVWDIPPLQIILIRKMYYVVQIIYIFVHPLARLSILFLYLRIFPGDRFRMITKICIAWVVCHFIGFLMAVVLQCIPISALFDLNVKGKCVNSRALGFAGAAVSILEDIVIMILPAPELRSLNLSLRKKVALIFMFAVGSFACIASIVRLNFMMTYGNSFDVTWDQVDVMIWSEIEAHAAVICACLITLRGLFVKYWTALFPLSRTSELRNDSTIPSWRAGRSSKLAEKLGYTNNAEEISSGSDERIGYKTHGDKAMMVTKSAVGLELEEIGRLG